MDIGAEEREVQTAGSVEACIERAPRRTHRVGDNRGSRRGERLGHCGGIRHLERDPDRPGDPAPHLQVVDVGSVILVGQLDGRPARREEDHLPAVRGECRHLSQAEAVTVEPQRRLVVGCGDDEP